MKKKATPMSADHQMQPRVKHVTVETLRILMTRARENGFMSQIDDKTLSNAENCLHPMMTTNSRRGIVSVEVYLRMRNTPHPELVPFAMDIDYDTYDSVPDLDRNGNRQ